MAAHSTNAHIEQATDLHEPHVLGQLATPGAEPPKRDRCLGRPTEISETPLGEVIAHHGTVMHLPDDLNTKA